LLYLVLIDWGVRIIHAKIAKVAVSKAVYTIDKPYDYLIPKDMEETLQPGMRVLVPFGAGNRGSDGLVLAVQEGNGTGLKTMIAQLDDTPVLDERGIQLALWIRERCFCTVSDAVKTMLPAGLWFSLKDCVSIRDGVDRELAYRAAAEGSPAHQLVQMLLAWGGQGSMEQIQAAFGAKDPNPAIRQLANSGIVELVSNARRVVNDKKEKLATLIIPAEEAMARVIPRRKSAPLRYAVIELLCAIGYASTKDICYFTGASMQTLKSLEKSGILSMEQKEVFRRPKLEEVDLVPPPVLNEGQQSVFEQLCGLLRTESASVALLYGVTGSGKTQIYIRLIQQALERGKKALVLVPEIALTPQLLRSFLSHFGQQIAVLHSALPATARYDEWKRIRSGEAGVVIGTRSAVFAPLDHLGLIVLDEEQENSYKSENTPRYHARDVAKYRCAQSDALLVLGSATPSVESMFYAREGTYHFFTLEKRFNEQALPHVLVQDMKQELRSGNSGATSALLRKEIQKNLEAGEQTILFLNRRGASRMVICEFCGEVPQCPRCSVKLTYHSANGRLMCHYCGHSQPFVSTCPVCGSALNFFGIGTQKVQEELETIFPGQKILRMDADTVSATHTHQEIFDRFQKENIPILVGTQMVAKGLDFENVTLVGVISADQSLYLDDFRAGERTFSQITQAIGRAGRGTKKGRAVIQTYTPEHDVIISAAAQDYLRFYEQEILLRQLRNYPPFRDIILLNGAGVDETGVLRCMTYLRDTLSRELARLDVGFQLFGPAPAAVTKVNGRYRYRLTFLGKNERKIRLLLAHVLRATQKDKTYRGVSVYADSDPYQ